MAFKEVEDLNTETTISLGGTNRKTGKANPTKIEGYYLGKRTVEDTKKKSGVSFIYVLKTPKGNVGVWGKTDLDRKMQSVAVGSMIRVTQNGMRKTANNDMYVFKVEVDEENVLDIQALPTSSTTSDNSHDNTEDDVDYSLAEDDSSLDETEEAIPARATPPRIAAKTPGAEQQAAVKALLNSARRQ